jgi:hypothetical protein
MKILTLDDVVKSIYSNLILLDIFYMNHKPKLHLINCYKCFHNINILCNTIYIYIYIYSLFVYASLFEALLNVANNKRN